MNASIRIPIIEVISKMSSIKKKDIILDSIVVYGLVNDSIDKKVDYQLHVVDDNIVIYPIGNYEQYLLKYERVMSTEEVIKVTTLADEYSNDYQQQKELLGVNMRYTKNVLGEKKDERIKQ